MKWMSARQKGSRLHVSELAVCGLPTALKGTLLKELTIENLHCGEFVVIISIWYTLSLWETYVLVYRTEEISSIQLAYSSCCC